MKDKKESHAHYEAKMLMVKWLRAYAKKAKIDNYTKGLLLWRVNRGSPFYGVFEEYPLGKNEPLVWDEGIFMETPKEEKNWPDFKWMKKNYPADFRIVDIAIQHKGQIAYVIEIVHKHKISKKKLNFLKNLPSSPIIYEIPSEWVLGQIDTPKKIPKDFLVN